ncbi:hypothetical protein AB2B38_003365 [Balneola sp. MJW-20]|uniref:hypothetical protein n=1 Tax=Gracilimonas aurantiaca TaxID=3234185 RepID=UPI0034656D70
MLSPALLHAQNLTEEKELPSPRGAFLRSLAVPGWGHYYVDRSDWTRGKYHLASDVVLILSYVGLNTRANYLEDQLFTYANSRAGTSLKGKNRDYRIAIGNYNSLSDYNNAQLQTRNWDRLFPETAEFQWEWQEAADRNRYRDKRETIDRNRGQLPTLLGLMVANRLISGLHAFVQARNMGQNIPEAGLTYLNEFGQPGVTAHIRFRF